MGLNKSTLSEQIYQILRNDILTQKIPCGEKLTLKLLQERFSSKFYPDPGSSDPANPGSAGFLLF